MSTDSGQVRTRGTPVLTENADCAELSGGVSLFVDRPVKSFSGCLTRTGCFVIIALVFLFRGEVLYLATPLDLSRIARTRNGKSRGMKPTVGEMPARSSLARLDRMSFPIVFLPFVFHCFPRRLFWRKTWPRQQLRQIRPANPRVSSIRNCTMRPGRVSSARGLPIRNRVSIWTR